MRTRTVLTVGWMVLSAALGSGCAHFRTVPVPPQYDLTRFPAVGLIEFSSSSSHGELPAYAGRRFMQQLLEAQPGLRLLELGPLDAALASVGRPRLDAEAVRALCSRNGVQALFVGSLEVTEPRPEVSVSSFASVGVSADVTATVGASLYEAASGALIWTRTLTDRDSAGGVDLSGGAVAVGVQGQDRAYLRMVNRTTFSLADPFRTHWVQERVD